MADKRPRKIIGLRWEETSGVDHPANEEEGWAVYKSVDTDDGSAASDEVVTDEDLDQLVDEERAAIEKEQRVLDDVKELIKDAPDEVVDAFEAMEKWLKDARESSKDTPGLLSKETLRQIYRVVRRALKGPEPKTYSKEQIARALQSNAEGLVKDLAAIFNDKDSNKEAKVKRLNEVLKALHESVAAELDSSDDEEPD